MYKINNYLRYLQESRIKRIVDIFKDIGLKILMIERENEACTKFRETKGYTYLLHGTRHQYVSSIKKGGLLLKMHKKRTKAEGDLSLDREPQIWFGNVYTGNPEGFGGSGISKEVVYMVAKVYNKYLKYNTAGAYQYFHDVPSKDLIWQNDKRFLTIIKKSPCILYKVK